MAAGPCRPCQPRPAQGNVGNRELPHGSPRRPCRALRRLRLYDDCLQLLPQPALPEVPGALRPRNGWLRARPTSCRCRTITWCSRYRRPSPTSPNRNKAVIYDLLFKASAETLTTIAADPKHLGARIGITSVLHTWGSAMTHHPHVHMIVPGGGISPDGERWVACRPGFFLPVRVLSRLFRRLFLEKLMAAHTAAV
jgi:hypothetical protein